MLELKNISFSAENEDGKKQILKNVNLKIDEGFVVITGPNGGGKSTLAKIIAGIITPTEGQILLDGEDITSLLHALNEIIVGREDARAYFVLLKESRGLIKKIHSHAARAYLFLKEEYSSYSLRQRFNYKSRTLVIRLEHLKKDNSRGNSSLSELLCRLDGLCGNSSVCNDNRASLLASVKVASDAYL